MLSIVHRLLKVLPAGSGRRFLLTYGILTAALALLDLVALGLVGTLLQSVRRGFGAHSGSSGASRRRRVRSSCW